MKKIVVDFTDDSSIDADALKWCDVYGKINLENNFNHDHKIISIGPSFGIQIYSLFDTIWFAFTNLFKAYSRILNKRKFLSDYKAQFLRPKFSQYNFEKPISDYVFFMASLWKKEPDTNTFRANYIKACKKFHKIEFEGGFAPRTKMDIFGFEDVTTNSRVSMDEYIKKIKKSLLVFNTPAVASCHGWKLAEYLCLGKIIISTPLKRCIPNENELKNSLIFTDGSVDDITLKINEIFKDQLLREKLEANARLYYDNYLAPLKILDLLIIKSKSFE